MAECDGDWNSVLLSTRTGELIDDNLIRTEPDGPGRIKGRRLDSGEPLSGFCTGQGPVRRISFTMTKSDGSFIIYDGLIVTIAGITTRYIIVNGRYQKMSSTSVAATVEDEGTWIGQKPIT